MSTVAESVDRAADDAGTHTRHRFRLPGGPEVTHVRLDVYPDGGMARVRRWGEPTPDGRDDLVLRWYNLLPATQVTALLTARGAGGSDAEATVTGRPVMSRSELPAVLQDELTI